MSNIDIILNQLDKVKNKGGGKYVALCPCHDEKTPSLHVSDMGDGRILAHCFGCGANGIDIILALGIDQSLLFPDKPKNGEHGYKRERVPFPARQVLQSLLFESNVIMLAAAQIVSGKKLSATDFKRVELANNRIYEAVNYAKKP